MTIKEDKKVEFGSQYNKNTKFFTVCYNSKELTIAVPIKLDILKFNKESAKNLFDALDEFLK